MRTAFKALIFGPDFKVQRTISLGGLLSRARVSPDGRYGATTSFLAGHSYVTSGQFSTSTTLLDLTTGKKLYNLEKLDITRDGKPFRASDFNYWGVTFANDGKRFYATLATNTRPIWWRNSRRAPVASSARTSSARRFPPTTPGSRSRSGSTSGKGQWRFTVLDMRTVRETPLAERQSVDDQAAWLDNDRVLYGYKKAVWTVRADGSDRPRLYLADALSPTVVRPTAA